MVEFMSPAALGQQALLIGELAAVVGTAPSTLNFIVLF